MAKLFGNSDYLCVSGEKMYIFSLKNSGATHHVIEFQSDLNEKISKEDTTYPDCCTLSPCGQYLILCIKKELICYDAKLAERMFQLTTQKTISCVRFFNKSSRFLVGDRSGYLQVYAFDRLTAVKDPSDMGHNSMLTDAIVSINDDYIITCDRDDKIRVTHYPNLYNIQSFCLGHGDFVSSLAFLPSDPRVLVSTSGDGTLRLWDFINGIELLVVKGHGAMVKAVGVCDGAVNVIAVQYHSSEDVDIVSISGTKDDGFQLMNLRTKHVDDILLDVSVVESSLVFLLMKDGKPSLVLEPERDESVFHRMMECLSDAKFERKDSIHLLFKRRFDCVQEYHARKKARIENSR